MPFSLLLCRAAAAAAAAPGGGGGGGLWTCSASGSCQVKDAAAAQYSTTRRSLRGPAWRGAHRTAHVAQARGCSAAAHSAQSRHPFFRAPPLYFGKAWSAHIIDFVSMEIPLC